MVLGFTELSTGLHTRTALMVTVAFGAGAASAWVALRRLPRAPSMDWGLETAPQPANPAIPATAVRGRGNRGPTLVVESGDGPDGGGGGGFTITPGVVWEGAVYLADSEMRAARHGNAARRVRRRVLCGDALDFLAHAGEGGIGGHIITSLPCIDEMSDQGLTVAEYREWFAAAARAVLLAAHRDNFVIFYQSDEVSVGGTWLSKFAWIHAEAERVGSALLWHKVVCIRPPDGHKFGKRPAYSHMMCFSRGLRLGSTYGQPDVLSSRGAMLWPKAMGQDACKLACTYIRKEMVKAGRRDEESMTVVDPFCGRGTALSVANVCHLHAFGVERSRKRCVAAAKEAL